MKFSDIPGHDNIKQRMRQMVATDHLPHAVLIEGPAGTGKLSLARAFAQYIQCENRDSNGDACGECRSCRLHQSLNHVDTHYSFPVVKLDSMNTAPVSEDFYPEWTEFLNSNKYSDIAAWAATFNKRNAHPIIYVNESEALVRKLAFTSHVSRYKIVIMWLPERLHETAANKLLKMIEEPFEDTVFILVSDNPAAILPTIYSRVQRLVVKRLPDSLVAHNIMKMSPMAEQDALAIAHNADGNMITALDLLHQDKDSKTFFDNFVSLMRLAYMRDVAKLRNWADNLAALGREQEVEFYVYCTRMVRENFVMNFNVPDLNYLSGTERAFASKFSRFITVNNVEKLIEVFTDARRDISGNGNGKIVNFDVAIKTILLLKQ
ncbi:MAG: AAA family ATPase [Firmicutes bacterium]|nr:AAA family ATPase [Bacillota bacterium]MCM1401096.1 AAA family ATPase [Bacteroides sp.]MCM1477081.1 AAA family ATPase [Bacteroides sp.]